MIVNPKKTLNKTLTPKHHNLLDSRQGGKGNKLREQTNLNSIPIHTQRIKIIQNMTS
jgi:hypothetical protein